MHPKQSIIVQLEIAPGDALRLGDVLLDVKFFTRGKFRYQFKAGRTDASGRLVITYDELERQRLSNAEWFLMDYNTPLIDCDPIVELSMPSEKELKMAADSVQQNFGTQPDWASRWPSNAQLDAAPRKVDLSNTVTRVPLLCVFREPDGGRERSSAER